MKLSQHEIEIIECMVMGWAESENKGLYGSISYQCVVDLCKKLNIQIPSELEYMCSDQYEKDMECRFSDLRAEGN